VQPTRRSLSTVATSGGLLLLLGTMLLMDDGHLPMQGARAVGYAVCHQIPSHSIFIDGQQLPLCARCTGIYLGFLVGLLGLGIQGRLRCSGLPTWNVVSILLLAFGVMAADGVNSLMGLVGAPQAYPSTNLARLVTGTAAGCALALMLLPLLNDSLWADSDRSPNVSDLGELAGYALLAGVMVMLVNSDQPLLLLPITLFSLLGVVATISAAAAALAASLLRAKGKALSFADARPALLSGFALAALAMTLLGETRVYLTPILGL
jgi:uncharacterized membrane protein